MKNTPVCTRMYSSVCMYECVCRLDVTLLKGSLNPSPVLSDKRQLFATLKISYMQIKLFNENICLILLSMRINFVF